MLSNDVSGYLLFAVSVKSTSVSHGSVLFKQTKSKDGAI